MVKDVDYISMAEMLAAFDCIIHHLVDESDIKQWTLCAVRDGHDWHILNEFGAVGRREHYTCDAEGLRGNEFERIVRTFASIIKAQCFDVKYRDGAFDCCHTGVVR